MERDRSPLALNSGVEADLLMSRTKKPPFRVASVKQLEPLSNSNNCKMKKVLPGIELFSQGAAPQLSLPLLRFTPEFEMDRGGTTAPWTPG